MCVSASTMATLYRGFNITEDNDFLKKKTVDDFMFSIEPTKTPDDCTQIDAARIAAARASACIMLLPVSLNSNQQLQVLKKMKANGSTAVCMYAPNRIQLKHLTASSRVRNLTHGGILGVLTLRLNRDPTQQKQWHQFNGALCVVQHANSTDGCAHVKWSMPEFQCAFNIGVKRHSTVQNHINEMDADALIAHFNMLNTAENRNTFLAECSAVAHHPANQSRFVVPMDPHNSLAMLDWTAKRPVVLENTWIMDLMATFSKLCSAKMEAVNNPDASTLERCMRLVDLYRFIVQTEWMVNDPNVRCVLNLNGFYAAYTKKLMHMATEGVEHSAYMLGRLCPEMMTPELHLRVVANPRFYRIPQMLIADDDEVFGPMKVACQGFMPLMADPLPVSRQLHPYSDSDYYSDDTTDIHDDDDDAHDDDDDDEDEDDDDELVSG